MIYSKFLANFFSNIYRLNDRLEAIVPIRMVEVISTKTIIIIRKTDDTASAF